MPNIPAYYTPPKTGPSALKIVLIVMGCVVVVGVLVVALLIAILVPSLSRARERARETVVMSNMHSLFVGIEIYTSENSGALPPHLAPVIIEQGIPGKALRDPRFARPSLPPMIMPPVKEWKSIAPAIDAYCDFVYLGSGLEENNINRPTNTLILYAKDATTNGQWIVGFADGHIETMDPTNLPLFMDELNRIRAAEKLPPLSRMLPMPAGLTPSGPK